MKDVKPNHRVRPIPSTETDDSEVGGFSNSFEDVDHKPKKKQKDIKAQINELRTKIYQNQLMNQNQLMTPCIPNYPYATRNGCLEHPLCGVQLKCSFPD